ncbi:hypothetical protein AGMMS49938_05600 [Fibrobacterales bacterium]|nr:hypothetical protein AGMMS49938_05600 [Fibrobacterales bacterium]
MAENLNFDTKSDGSVCYGNDKTNETNCTTYGRLYDWETATTACPGGWHLPSDAEWTTLATYVGGNSTAGTKLKATSGWDNNGNGTDDYGFSALPGGYGYSSGNFYNVDKYGTWWSATEATNASNAYYRRMQDSNGSMDRVNYGKVEGLFSVRCLKN